MVRFEQVGFPYKGKMCYGSIACEGDKIRDVDIKEENLFLDNMGQIVERERLLKVVWDINYYGSGRVLDDTVRRLRKKMPDLKLETVYGLGYRLNAL